MPYYIFRVMPFGRIEQLAEFDVFKDASAHAKSLRAASGAPATSRIKIMFANSALQAEDQLLQIRQPGPAGDD